MIRIEEALDPFFDWGGTMSETSKDALNNDEEESLEELKVKARELHIPGIDRMNRDEILHQILKHQGGDGGLGI